MKRALAARGVGSFAFAALAFAGARASASTSYPAEMEQHLGLSYAPKCELCHEQADGGPTDTPFAKSMTARGMKGGGDLASLDAALDAMKKDRVESDGDGAFDLDEIAYGGDPNHADLPQGTTGPAPSYGCSVDRRGDDAGVALAVGGVLVAMGRRRVRGRR